MDNKTYNSSFTPREIKAFRAGTDCLSYRRLGAHIRREDGVSGVRFSLWAPNAQQVSVITSRTEWDEARGVMAKSEDGIWDVFLPGLRAGDVYRFEIGRAHV